MAKNRKNSSNSKSSSSSSNYGKSGTTTRRRSSSSSKRNSTSRGKNTNEAESHFDSIADRRNNQKNNNSNSSSHSKNSSDSNDNDNNYDNNSKGNNSYENEPINDPSYDDYDNATYNEKGHYNSNDADMNFTEEEIYGNDYNENANYSKGGNSDADMTFTEEEIYGDTYSETSNYSKEGNDDSDMTFTEEEVYGDSSTNNSNNEEADMTFTEEEVYGNSSSENSRTRSNQPRNRVPSEFETCTVFKTNYDEFRETLVRNSSNLRRTMISRSNPSHIGSVIDRTPDLRNIHREYASAGTRPGDRICLRTEIIRDQRRYVEFIRFHAPDMMTFEDEPVTASTQEIQRRELRRLHQNFTSFTSDVQSRVRTYFDRPDSHDTTLANSISMYCNNMIRLSRRDRTMIPAEVSRDFARPIVNRAIRDWNALTNNNSAPALQGQDDLIIRRYRAWARAVLLERGNTTDEATINNFVSTFNGYRNY